MHPKLRMRKTMNRNDMHVVLDGDPYNGFVVRGPFESFEKAESWCDRFERDDRPVWVVPVVQPMEM